VAKVVTIWLGAVMDPLISNPLVGELNFNLFGSYSNGCSSYSHYIAMSNNWRRYVHG
jgi:hypothetical protein